MAFLCSVVTASEDQYEEKIGKKAKIEVEKKLTVIGDPSVQARVGMVFGRLTPYMVRQNLDTSVGVISSDIPNAFALPWGYIYVTTGMLSIVKTNDELAAVLAHEIAHVDGRHVMKQMARNSKMSILTLAIAIASANPGVALMADLLGVAVSNEYSRDFEEEADIYALQLLEKSGYNPIASLTLLEKMRAWEMTKPMPELGVYRTHPRLDERIRYVNVQLSNMRILINRKKTSGILAVSKVLSLNAQGQTFLEIKIDNNVVLNIGGLNPEIAEKLSLKIVESLDKHLQLELEPYEISISPDGNSLLIAGTRMLSLKDLPLSSKEAAKKLEEFKEKVIDAILRARNIQPIYIL